MTLSDHLFLFALKKLAFCKGILVRLYACVYLHVQVDTVYMHVSQLAFNSV